ncbi:hypothetical protein Vafri_17705 [Volvox africanus]|uniref:DNA2/NAM7 helicase helicase domain-containing protein n=1 Tax=Volvox africanus TaxID=51714 RepID=A0A8J4BLJ7_9CHLO|nr:hypothetical protein Vafri_17705 [Volvox africanus]
MPTRQASTTTLFPAMHSLSAVSLVPVNFRLSKVAVLVVRSYRSDGQQPHQAMPVQPPEIPTHAEQVQQSYQQKMQELLQKQRQAAREQIATRDSAAVDAAGQPAAPASLVSAVAAHIPTLAESSLPPLTPTGSAASPDVPPTQQPTAQTARHEHLSFRQPPLHSTITSLPKPESQMDIARDVGQGFSQQRQHLSNPTAMQSLHHQDRNERPGMGAWPDLLPSVRPSKKPKGKATDSAGVGLNLLPSVRMGSGGGNGGTVVSSTRRAKSTFGAASDPGYGRQLGYKSSVPCSNSFSDDWGNGTTTAGVRRHQPPEAAVRDVSQPPMAQRTALSLNSNMPFGSPAAAAQQFSINGAGVPGVTGAAPTAIGGSRDSVGYVPASTKGNAGASGGQTAGGSVTPPAVAVSGAAAADVPVAKVKKKPARPATLWLSSFVQAAGRAGGTSAGAPAVTPAAVVERAKQPVADAGVAAAAMVRTAAERPAVELAESVSDLPVTIQQLQARLEAAVHAEQESELRALRALYASGSLRQLQREGIVLVGLAAVEGGRLYRSTLWRFSLMQKKSASTTAAPCLPYHKLRSGTSVIITAHTITGGDGAGAAAIASVDAETGLPADGVEGVVVEANKDHLVVALEGRSHEAFQTMVSEVRSASTSSRTSSGHGTAAAVEEAVVGPFKGWRLDQSVRDTTARRHLEGIRRLGTWTEPSADDRVGEARVRAILAGSRSAALLAAEAPDWVKEDRWREDARAALASQQGLNDSQRRAVAAALTRTVTLWQGPPGTGKTRTLLALIEILVRVRNAGLGPVPRAPRGSSRASVAVAKSPRAAAMGPVLAVADTNAAVDNLVDGLSARGVKAVRLGPASKARESLRHLSLEAQAEATPVGRRAVALRTQALRKQELWRQEMT